MTPGQVLLEPCGKHEPVIVAKARWAMCARLHAGRTGLIIGDLGRLGVAAGVAVGFARQALHVIEVREPEPQGVVPMDSLQPDLDVPLLQGNLHARREVHPEAEVAR